jgi:GDPmannose 4,6-dehydratase
MGKAIIFGASGQDGYYLSQLLSSKGIESFGVSRSNGNWVQGSVADRDLVERLIKIHQPSYVFHLAANSTTKHSSLFENHETICTGTWNILEAVRQHSPKTKVFISGSALQFENRGVPIDETACWHAPSAYSVSRIQSVYAGRYYRSLGLDVYVGYFFNHDSPLRSERHITQKIAQAAKRIASNSTETLTIGNIQVEKEFTFAGDVAQAIWVLVNNSLNVYECVIGSGRAYSIERWISICFSRFNLNWKHSVKTIEGYTPEYKILVSKPDLLHSLGWRQEVELDDLAAMMLR